MKNRNLVPMKEYSARYKVNIPKYDFNKVKKEDQILEQIYQEEDYSKVRNSQQQLPKLNSSQSQQQIGFQRGQLKSLKNLSKSILFEDSSQEQQGSWVDDIQSKQPKVQSIFLQKQVSHVQLRSLGQQHRSSQFEYQPTNASTIFDNENHIKPSNFDLEQFFDQYGLQTSKDLPKFDFWDEKLTPEQILAEVQANEAGPHGKSPIFSNKRYIWQNVRVMTYDKNLQKYLVEFTESKLQKWVYRLSLMLNSEDPSEFNKRYNESRDRLETTQDEIRFLKYIMSKELIYKIDAKTVQNIVKKVKINAQFGTPPALTLMTEVLEQVRAEYNLFMKKCYVLGEMLDSSNINKFKKLRILLRKPTKLIPKIGTVKCPKYNYLALKDYVNKTHVSAQKQMIIVLTKILNRQVEYEKIYLMNTKHQIKRMPYLVEDYERDQSEYFVFSSKEIKVGLREWIISEIQEELKDIYKFYLTNPEEYHGLQFEREIKRFDFMFRDYIRQNIITANVQEYCQFIAKFTYPQPEQFWIVNKTPLLIIDLKIADLKQEDQKKLKKMSQINIFDQDLIVLSPSLEELRKLFHRPFRNIIELTNELTILERDLIPLIDIEYKQSLQIDLTYVDITQGIDQIDKYLFEAMKEPIEILQKYKEYQFIITLNTVDVLKNLFGKSNEFVDCQLLNKSEVVQTIINYTKSKEQIQRLSIDQVNTTMFQLRTNLTKKKLVEKLIEVLNAIFKKLSEICAENVDKYIKIFTEMHNKINSKPKDEDELIKLKSFIDNITEELKKLDLEVMNIYFFINLITDNFYEYPEEQMDIYWSLRGMPQEIRLSVTEGARTAAAEEAKFMDQLETEITAYYRSFDDLKTLLTVIKKFNNYELVKEYAVKVSTLKENIAHNFELTKSFNERQNIFKQPVTDYFELNDLKEDFQPFLKLWEMAIIFDMEKSEWTTGPFLKLNFSNIDKKIDNYYRSSLKLSKEFTEIEQDVASEMAIKLKEDAGEFKKKLWLIELLTTEAMVKKAGKYWKEVFEKCEIAQIEPNDDMKFTQLEKVGLMNHRDKIEEISKKAEKEYGLEKKLLDMIELLKQIQIGTLPYKNTGTYVLKSMDEIIQILDDNFNILLMMKSSPYIKPVQKEANALDTRIVMLQETIEGWLSCQRSWMYLEPILASDDIKKKLPAEKQKFDMIDKNWRIIMEQFNKEPSLWDGIDSERYRNDFDGYNKTLEAIQKSLSEYLETKRRGFPRFFFLSDDQLLEILAQTKDPLTVQKHVNKCFEAINLLQFNDKQEVCGMISPEKEQVEFNRKVNVNEGEKKGNVEKWLLEIEHEMMNTLRLINQQAVADTKTERTKWCLLWPAMVTLAGDMIRWTADSEQAITNMRQDNLSLKKYGDSLQTQMLTIVDMLIGDLSDNDRQTLGSLIVLDVHARDVIFQLVEEEIMNTAEFSWLSQLRYYWIPSKGPKDKIDIHVKIINASISYGFEYLGNSTRLVITPLTDRCYRTLMGAFHLYYGGAPEGPAGTGKTESTKDLAKAVAMQCIVFNCSDGLNFQQLIYF